MSNSTELLKTKVKTRIRTVEVQMIETKDFLINSRLEELVRWTGYILRFTL